MSLSLSLFWLCCSCLPSYVTRESRLLVLTFQIMKAGHREMIRVTLVAAVVEVIAMVALEAVGIYGNG